MSKGWRIAIKRLIFITYCQCEVSFIQCSVVLKKIPCSKWPPRWVHSRGTVHCSDTAVLPENIVQNHPKHFYKEQK
jgi:hypothetical protein